MQKSRLKTAILNVEGGEKDIRSERESWRNDRVEEALMRLRVTHASRAVAGYDDTAFSLDKQRLQLEAVSFLKYCLTQITDTTRSWWVVEMHITSTLNTT